MKKSRKARKAAKARLVNKANNAGMFNGSVKVNQVVHSAVSSPVKGSKGSGKSGKAVSSGNSGKVKLLVPKRSSTTEPLRGKDQVFQLLSFFFNQGQFRNCVLVAMGVYTGLRISDILSVSCDDVFDFRRGCVRDSFCVVESKTGKGKVIAINPQAKEILAVYFPFAVPGEPLILNKRTGKAISRIQAYRIIRQAGEALGFPIRVSCHSLRKVFGYHAWKDGASSTVIMDIYNHCGESVTRRYLGVSQDDRNAVYLGLNFGSVCGPERARVL